MRFIGRILPPRSDRVHLRRAFPLGSPARPAIETVTPQRCRRVYECYQRNNATPRVFVQRRAARLSVGPLQMISLVLPRAFALDLPLLKQMETRDRIGT